MTRLTTAELRGYQQICGTNGAIMVIACDQRGGIRKILASDAAGQAKITDDMLGDTKSDVARYLAAMRLASCSIPSAPCRASWRRARCRAMWRCSLGSTPRATAPMRTAIISRSWFPASPPGGCASWAARAARSWSICAPTTRMPTATTSRSSASASRISRRGSAARRRVPHLSAARRGRGRLQGEISFPDRGRHAALSRRSDQRF